MKTAKGKIKSDLIGNGSPESDLSSAELFEIIEKSLEEIPAKSNVLAIVPDKTRDDNTDLLFPFAAGFLNQKKIEKLDALIAQGTHPPMTTLEKRSKLGVGDGETILGFGQVFDHQWNDLNELITIGELSSKKVSEITNGLFEKPIRLSINKLLAPGNYDYVLIFGGVVPHEVAGFAGGAKYFFPGVSGAELTNATHWLGALSGIENTIGRIETPVRHLIETAADFIQPKIICFSSVLTRNAENRPQIHALFAGDFRGSFRRAAEISAKVHIKYTGRKFKRVVAILDRHYDELWTGGKASYKLGGIIETGGELVIYAPHLRCISDTHGAAIEKYGYAPVGKIKKMIAESGELEANLCVAAHLAHVAFAGREDDDSSPRFQISLASQIGEEICRKVNLGYLSPENFEREKYENDDDILIVENAGRDLYLVG